MFLPCDHNEVSTDCFPLLQRFSASYLCVLFLRRILDPPRNLWALEDRSRIAYLRPERWWHQFSCSAFPWEDPSMFGCRSFLLTSVEEAAPRTGSYDQVIVRSLTFVLSQTDTASSSTMIRTFVIVNIVSYWSWLRQLNRTDEQTYFVGGANAEPIVQIFLWITSM